MKLILTAEVDDLGLAGDVVEVADGYGRNYLLPRGLAILATRGAMKEAQALTRARKAREAKTLAGANAAKAALEARPLRIGARVDERGGLYGSVTAVDVHRVLRERGHEVERKRVALKGGLKQIGTYQVEVRVHPQVTATVTVEVVDEEGRVSAATIKAADEQAPAPLAGEAAQAAEAAGEAPAEDGAAPVAAPTDAAADEAGATA